MINRNCSSTTPDLPKAFGPIAVVIAWILGLITTRTAILHNQLHLANGLGIIALPLDINYPDIRRGHIGPLILDRQASVIQRHLDDAVSKGATLRTGGSIENHGGGLWLPPTIVTGVTHDMLLMTEETFGPVIPVMPYDTVADAVRLANDSQYGLSAAVIAGSRATSEGIGRQLRAGAVSLMDTTLNLTVMRDAEKDAFASSGLGGSRTGAAALLRFVRKKTLIANAGGVQSMRGLGEER